MIAITLTAPAYDALKDMADRHGGIGRGCYVEFAVGHGVDRTPCCGWGMAFQVKAENPAVGQDLIAQLTRWGVTTTDNDLALEDLPTFTAGVRTRVPFEEWARRVGVVRA